MLIISANSSISISDEFELTLSSGEYTITLYGKINVTITVATYKIYDGWKFDNPTTALAEAISSYEFDISDTQRSVARAFGREKIQIEIVIDAFVKVYVVRVTSCKLLERYGYVKHSKHILRHAELYLTTSVGQKDEFYKAYELEEDSVVDYPRAFGPEYEIEYVLDDLRDSYYMSFERRR